MLQLTCPSSVQLGAPKKEHPASHFSPFRSSELLRILLYCILCIMQSPIMTVCTNGSSCPSGSYLVLVDPFQKTEIGEKEEKEEKK